MEIRAFFELATPIMDQSAAEIRRFNFRRATLRFAVSIFILVNDSARSRLFTIESLPNASYRSSATLDSAFLAAVVRPLIRRDAAVFLRDKRIGINWKTTATFANEYVGVSDYLCDNSTTVETAKR